MINFFSWFYSQMLELFGSFYSFLQSIWIFPGVNLFVFILSITLISFFLPIIFTIVSRPSTRSRGSGGSRSDD